MEVSADSDQLERVFLRLGHAETDEQLQNIISKFLPPVLLKLSSTQEGVRKKLFIKRSCLVIEADQNLSEQSADGLLGSGGGKEAFYNPLFVLRE